MAKFNLINLVGHYCEIEVLVFMYSLLKHEAGFAYSRKTMISSEIYTCIDRVYVIDRK